MYFGRVLGHKWLFQRRHFPDEFRSDLYVFGIRRGRRMGTERLLIQNPVFGPTSYGGGALLKMTILDLECIVSAGIFDAGSFNLIITEFHSFKTFHSLNILSW